jgi:hypothetical protein
LRETLHKSCFACAEVTLQTDHVTGFNFTAESHSNAARLLGAAAEKFDGMRI